MCAALFLVIVMEVIDGIGYLLAGRKGVTASERLSTTFTAATPAAQYWKTLCLIIGLGNLSTAAAGMIRRVARLPGAIVPR